MSYKYIYLFKYIYIYSELHSTLMIHDLPMFLYRMGIKDHNGSNCLEKRLVIKWDWLSGSNREEQSCI